MAADVQGVEVLVDLKFILTLVNFITSSLKPLTKTSLELEPDYGEIGTRQSEKSDSKTKETSESQSSSKSSEPHSQSTEEGTSKMNVSVRVSRPCIALLENAEQPNSRALVLGVSMVPLVVGEFMIEFSFMKLLILHVYHTTLSYTYERVNCVHKLCALTPYSVVQSHCSILSCDTLSCCFSNSLENEDFIFPTTVGALQAL